MANTTGIRTACALLLTGFTLAAREVYVAGSFDPYWQKRYPMKKNRLRRLDHDPRPALAGRYKFDGKRRHAPALADAFGEWNNVLVVIARHEQ